MDGWTQAWIAQALGVSEDAISQWFERVQQESGRLPGLSATLWSS